MTASKDPRPGGWAPHGDGSSVFVYFPRGLQTGGPAALHQLVDAMRRLGVSAYLVPLPGTEGAQDVADYAMYDAPIRPRVEDVETNLVVVPEANLRALTGIRRAQTFVWWLSIDNSPIHYWSKRREREGRSLRYFVSMARMAMRRDLYLRRSTNLALARRATHGAQSAYAAFTIEQEGLPSAPLTDYTVMSEFNDRRIVPPLSRGKTVAFNPAKGGEIVERLRSSRPDIDWRPIQGMSRAEVIEMLSSSCIYLDAGHHPGKDRLPREAALCGAVVIALARGSAAFQEDMPIPGDFKIEPTGTFDDNILAAIDEVLQDPAESAQRQDEYRAWIGDEESRFLAEVRSLFVDAGFAPGADLKDGAV